jgi:hypothetical protein
MFSCKSPANPASDCHFERSEPALAPAAPRGAAGQGNLFGNEMPIKIPSSVGMTRGLLNIYVFIEQNL